MHTPKIDMKKSYRSLLLASALLLGLTACSDDEEGISSTAGGTSAGDGGAQSAQYAGTYSGSLIIEYKGEDLTGDDFTGSDSLPATMTINNNGTVSLKVEDESVGGSINANKIEVPMIITKNEDGVTCKGNALVKATVYGNELEGPVSGDAECKLGLIKREAELTGKITAKKR